MGHADLGETIQDDPIREADAGDPGGQVPGYHFMWRPLDREAFQGSAGRPQHHGIPGDYMVWKIIRPTLLSIPGYAEAFL